MPFNIPEDHPQLFFLPKEGATIQPIIMNGGAYVHVREAWWFTHPTKGLVFWRSEIKGELVPQCSMYEEIAKKMIEEFLGDWAVLEYIPDVWFPNDLSITATANHQIPS